MMSTSVELTYLLVMNDIFISNELIIEWTLRYIVPRIGLRCYPNSALLATVPYTVEYPDIVGTNHTSAGRNGPSGS